MDYRTVTVADKPTKAPSEFTVFEVEGDQYIFCPIRDKAYKVNNKPEEIVRQWWLYRLKEVYALGSLKFRANRRIAVGSRHDRESRHYGGAGG